MDKNINAGLAIIALTITSIFLCVHINKDEELGTEAYTSCCTDSDSRNATASNSPKAAETCVISSRSEENGLERNLSVFRVTAYCPCKICCGEWSDGITASGYKIKQGDKFVAADLKYPYNTIMNIPGYGKVKVLDRGGAIKRNKLDVYFDTHQEALNWGVQYLEVEVIKGHWQL